MCGVHYCLEHITQSHAATKKQEEKGEKKEKQDWFKYFFASMLHVLTLLNEFSCLSLYQFSLAINQQKGIFLSKIEANIIHIQIRSRGEIYRIKLYKTAYFNARKRSII